ncbi:MAG: hypothetical protein HC828_02795 [Blastochloris sp.]|nr:hypothetical protein [Blastochloris sp.]
MIDAEPTRLTTTGRIVGALFLLSNATFLIGALVLIEPIISATNYLLSQAPPAGL